MKWPIDPRGPEYKPWLDLFYPEPLEDGCDWKKCSLGWYRSGIKRISPPISFEESGRSAVGFSGEQKRLYITSAIEGCKKLGNCSCVREKQCWLWEEIENE